MGRQNTWHQPTVKSRPAFFLKSSRSTYILHLYLYLYAFFTSLKPSLASLAVTNPSLTRHYSLYFFGLALIYAEKLTNLGPFRQIWRLSNTFGLSCYLLLGPSLGLLRAFCGPVTWPVTGLCVPVVTPSSLTVTCRHLPSLAVTGRHGPSRVRELL